MKANSCKLPESTKASQSLGNAVTYAASVVFDVILTLRYLGRDQNFYIQEWPFFILFTYESIHLLSSLIDEPYI